MKWLKGIIHLIVKKEWYPILKKICIGKLKGMVSSLHRSTPEEEEEDDDEDDDNDIV